MQLINKKLSDKFIEKQKKFLNAENFLDFQKRNYRPSCQRPDKNIKIEQKLVNCLWVVTLVHKTPRIIN